MGQAQINVRTRACSRTSIARTRQAALTHNVRGKEITQNNLPAYFNSFLIRRQHNIHEHLTRNRHMLVTEKVHHKFAEKCIRYSVFKTVNDTPTQIIDKMYTHSLQGVANYSKNLLINEYDVRCCIRDCYICK